MSTQIVDKVVDFVVRHVDDTLTAFFLLAFDGCKLNHHVECMKEAVKVLTDERQQLLSDGQAYVSRNRNRKFSVYLIDRLSSATERIKEAKKIIAECQVILESDSGCLLPCLHEFPRHIISSYDQSRKARNLTETMKELQNELKNFTPDGGEDKFRMYVDDVQNPSSEVLENNGGSRVGVCYGMLGNDLPISKRVVEHYRWLKINKMRLYWPDRDALNALRGSNIELILDVDWDKLQDMANNANDADEWVDLNVAKYYPDVCIKYIAVGNMVLPKPESQFVLPAMRNVYDALRSANLHDKIKVSTAIDTEVLGDCHPPSAGAFSADSMRYMEPIVKFLAEKGSPLLCNVHPYYAYRDDPKDSDNPEGISLDYALFRAPGTVVVHDGNLRYQNLFDASVDAIYAAMEKVGGADVRIVVSETGWPWNGGLGASIENAASYNNYIISHVGNGTPRKPGPLETYIFSMFNENQKDYEQTDKYFGVFYSNGEPVYRLDF